MAGGALLVGALTAIVFLIRAGGDPAGADTWPISWELRSSDNGVLFQVIQDIAAGRPLDWSFSPQVYVFPELPLSGVAFAVSAGNVYGYYLAVAALNMAVLFLCALALVRVLWPEHALGTSVLRALLGTVPLLVLPLIGTSWILSFHLAPSYYFGEYAALLLAPVLLLARTLPVRILTGAALALTIASNPLTLVFAAPGALAALVVGILRAGPRAVLRPVGWVAGTLLLAAAARLVFAPLQGISPLSYIDPDRFAGRLAVLWPYYAFQLRDPAAAVVLILGALLAVGCLLAAIAAAVLVVRRRGGAPARRLLAVVYLGLIPLGGIAATFFAMITHYYYFWPALVLPYVLVLLAVPMPAVSPALLGGLAGIVVIALATGAIPHLGSAGRYFGYRNAETACIDDALAGGSAVGYATFSDARRLSLTSRTPFRLIQLNTDGTAHEWLTNTAYARTDAGSFFYLNGSGDEPALDTARIRERFGDPDRVVACSATQEVWLYEDAGKLARISAFYRGRA
ncbi:hypothetical protein [Protaetiibacter larvae]|uniref:hypothetical protein n=1 Tax=Protaetiibacter larvae TaxID=2592654 RepID=UPI001AEF4992|nr:hypothetical protein [Protaetiibacter larvae]